MNKVDTFHQLHKSGCFVIPNPWDRGSAIFLEKLGFKALATTSAGFAWSAGRNDNGVTVEQVLDHLETMSSAVSIPFNADFEGGFAVEPEGVAKNVTRACSTGIAGLSIEDSTHDKAKPLFDLALAVERIKAARAAIDKSGTRVLLTARCEGFIAGVPDIKEVTKRIEAYAAAGADCLFAPGIKTKDDVSAVVKAVAPKPINLILPQPWLTFAEAEALGVRRISVGSGLARAAWGGFARAAKQIAEKGTFDGLVTEPLDLNGIFR